MRPASVFTAILSRLMCGAALAVLTIASAVTAFGQHEHVLYAFHDQQGVDGAFPHASLIADVAGNLYGTTGNGGMGCNGGCGTVFELIAPNTAKGVWTQELLYEFNFNGENNGDGANPLVPLLFDDLGNLYGTTNSGGNCPSCGLGFELTPRGLPWQETILYGVQTANSEPVSGLVFDRAGNLYGAAYGGSAGCGTVYQVSPPATSGQAWIYTTIYTFQGGNDGCFPAFGAGLVIDSKGNLYGVTAGGGRCSFCGTVFKLIPPTVLGGTWTERILHYFQHDGIDGTGPISGLTFYRGAFYGTTEAGGQFELGTVYKLTLAGRAETVIYNVGTDPNESLQESGVVADEAGNLYGANIVGSHFGIIFELQPPSTGSGSWTETVLYTFLGGIDGRNPSGLLYKRGTLYGTAQAGGDLACQVVGCGVVFAITR